MTPLGSPEEIFLALAGLLPGERETYLLAACGGDASLRDGVERLEAEEAASDAAWHGAIGSEAARAGSRRRIGPYRVSRKLGHGGMGTVYLAVRDDDEYRKEVAIKVARASLATEESLARFRYERQILASLEHPNIARLLEGGTSPDGEPYIVMEYVAGVSIVTYSRGQNLDTAAKLRLILKVAGAVDYAHRHLVIHRDLKPSNILVTPDGEPKLLDFGIAKILPGEGEGALTESPMLTIGYSSPEQLEGRLVTVASDVYSLGLVACELLTGSPRRTDSLNSVRQLPKDLMSILRKALETDARRRYPSINEFSADIERFLRGKPVTARRQTPGYRLGKFLGRHRAGAAVALLLALSVAGGWWATLREARRTHMRLTQVRQLANAMLFDLHDRIRTLPGSTGARVYLAETAHTYLASLEGDAAADPAIQAEIAAGYERLGDVQGGAEMASAGRVGAAVDSYRKAVALRGKLAAGKEVSALRQLALVQVKAGNALALRGASGEALVLLRAAVDAAGQAWSREPEVAANGQAVLEAEYRLGDWLLRKGRATEALPHARRGLAVARQLLERHPGVETQRSEWMALRRLGDAALQSGQLEEARIHFASAAALGRSGGEPMNREGMLLELAQGNVLGNPLYLNLGDLAKAEEHYRRAFDWAHQRVEDDPKSAVAQSDLAAAAARVAATLWERRPDEAVRLYDQVVQIRGEQLKRAPENVELIRLLAYELANSANPLRALGQLAEAERRARRALELDAEMMRRDPVRVECCSDVPMYAIQLGDALWRQGRKVEAGESYARAASVAESYGVRETCGVFCTKDWALGLEKVARWHGAMGRAAEARAWAARSLSVWQGWVARNGSNVYIEKKLKELGSLAG